MTTEQSWGQPPPLAYARSGPSVAWYWIAGLIVLLGIAGAVWFGIRGVSRFSSVVSGMERVDVPGQTTLQLEADGYYIYYEDGPVPRHLQIDVVGGDGQAVPVLPYIGDVTYNAGGRSGTAVATFDVPASGSYQLNVSSEDGTGTVAIGRGDVARGVIGLVGGIFGAIGIAGLSLIIAVVIVIIVAVKRSRARSQQLPGQSPFG